MKRCRIILPPLSTLTATIEPATLNSPFSGTITKNSVKCPFILDCIAEANGLPYSDSYVNLVEYSQMDPSNLLVGAAQNGDIRVVNSLTSTPNSFSIEDYNDAMAYAALNGCQDIVDKMLSMGAENYNWSLLYAAKGGHQSIVNQMLDLGADDYEGALREATRKGHRTIANQMILLKNGSTVSGSC